VNVAPDRRVLVSLFALPCVAAALLLRLPTAPLRAPVPIPIALLAGLLAGASLSSLLARGRMHGVPVTLAVLLVVVGASEEVLWRGFALVRLSVESGVVPAFVLTTAGFAAVHYPALRARGVRIHLLTGAVFATVFVTTGSLAGCAAAHALYNLLVVARGGTAPPAAAASLCGVVKRFGAIAALDGVDITVAEGEIVALLGPNGAGKTTAVRLLLGLLRPDRGTVEVLGRDPRSPAARTAVGATPQEMSFPPTLRAGELVEFVRAHYRRPLPSNVVLETFALADVARRQTGGLSGGQRRRLAAALAFAGDPQLAILDEPTAGLDVETRRSLWDAIRRHAGRGRAVLLTTHHLDEAEALAHRIVVVAGGKVLAEGSASHIKGAAPTLEEGFLALVRGGG
jgi:ABC-2 type transport system ATP-binding protein